MTADEARIARIKSVRPELASEDERQIKYILSQIDSKKVEREEADFNLLLSRALAIIRPYERKKEANPT
jgi:hypothetical protein